MERSLPQAEVGAGLQTGPGSVSSAVRKIRATLDLLLVGIGLVLIYNLSPFEIDGDGFARFDAVSRLLLHGEVVRMPYSMVGPLLSVPLWLLGYPNDATEWWTTRYNFALFVSGLVAFYYVLRHVLGREMTARFLLFATTASMFPYHLGRYYGEVFTALLVGLGLTLIATKKSAAGWSLAVLGVVNIPASLLGLGLTSSMSAWSRRHAKYLIPLVVAVALVMLEAWLRRGGPFVTGYEGNAGARTILPYSGLPGFSYPFVLGLVSILFSFGKGLVFFVPGLLLAPAVLRDRSDPVRTVLVLWLVFLAGLVLVYAKWWAWYGGTFWGPRFFLFASLPAALAMTAWSSLPFRSWPAELAGLVAVAWSFWVGVNGLVYGLWAIETCTADQFALELLCWYVPEFSPLFRPLVVPKSLSGIEWAVVSYAVLVYVYSMSSRVVYLTKRNGANRGTSSA